MFNDFFGLIICYFSNRYGCRGPNTNGRRDGPIGIFPVYRWPSMFLTLATHESTFIHTRFMYPRLGRFYGRKNSSGVFIILGSRIQPRQTTHSAGRRRRSRCTADTWPGTGTGPGYRRRSCSSGARALSAC